jgi:hypothetical protein
MSRADAAVRLKKKSVIVKYNKSRERAESGGPKDKGRIFQGRRGRGGDSVRGAKSDSSSSKGGFNKGATYLGRGIGRGAKPDSAGGRDAPSESRVGQSDTKYESQRGGTDRKRGTGPSSRPPSRGMGGTGPNKKEFSRPKFVRRK